MSDQIMMTLTGDTLTRSDFCRKEVSIFVVHDAREARIGTLPWNSHWALSGSELAPNIVTS